MKSRCYGLIKIIGFFVTAILFFNSTVAAEPLRIATLQIMPYGFIDRQDKTVGILYDLTCKIAEEAGFPYTNKLYPFMRIVQMMKNGSADITITLPHKSMKEVAVPILSVVPSENVVIGPKGSKFNSLKDLHGKTVGVIRGASYDDSFSADSAIRKCPIDKYNNCIKMMFRQRVDAIAGVKWGILYAGKNNGYEKNDFGKPLLLNTDYGWLFFSKKTADDETLAKLKSAAEKIIKNGTVQNIIAKYITE
jgi:ABC-type amino acid transport substrate-binding protein